MADTDKKVSFKERTEEEYQAIENKDAGTFYLTEKALYLGDKKLTNVVDGVKGAEESEYKIGNVSLSPDNIGALPTKRIAYTSTTKETALDQLDNPHKVFYNGYTASYHYSYNLIFDDNVGDSPLGGGLTSIYGYSYAAGNYGTQLAIKCANGRTRFRIRNLYNDVWSDWAYVYDSVYKPTPAEIGAVSTDEATSAYRTYNLSSAGWYRIATLNRGNNTTLSCDITIKSTYNNAPTENHKVALLCGYYNVELKSIYDHCSTNSNTRVFTKIRCVRRGDNYGNSHSIEIYYNYNMDNRFTITLENFVSSEPNVKWELQEATKITELSTDYTSVAELDLALKSWIGEPIAIKDTYNNAKFSGLAYASPGLTATDAGDWFAYWDQSTYEYPTVRAMASSQVKAKLGISSVVTGIKGNAEAAYRTGQVNLTASNIGAIDKNGDTVNGNLIFTVANMVRNQSYTSNYTKAIEWNMDGATGFDYPAQIGCHNTGGDGSGSITILPYRYSGSNTPWGGSVGLFIAKDILRIDGASVLTSNNLGYTANSKNYPIQLSGNKMYVNVPWVDTNTTYSLATASANGLMSAADKDKVDGITNEAYIKYVWSESSSRIGFEMDNPSARNFPITTQASYRIQSLADAVDDMAQQLVPSGIFTGYITTGQRKNTTLGERVTCIGIDCEASGDNSFSGGNYSTATAEGSFSSGLTCYASGAYGVAMGYSARAGGIVGDPPSESAGAIGLSGIAYNLCSFATAGGSAGGNNSCALGKATHSYTYSQCVVGKYNKASTTAGGIDTTTGDAFIIGNGTLSTSYSNAFRVTFSGEVMGTQAYKTSGADYAEFIYEWYDNNEAKEDRIGYFVTIKNKKLYKATSKDYIAGIVSGNPSVVGNGDEDYYWKYERDEFNRIKWVDSEEIVSRFDEEKKQIIHEKTGNVIEKSVMAISPDYDPEQEYIERKNRPEWDYVGMLGVLPVRDDGTCIVDGWCKCNDDGIATYTEEEGFSTYRVIERVNENVIKVILK